MAAPHVTGAAALYLSVHPDASPSEVHAALVGNATTDRISGVGSATPDRFLYTGGPDARWHRGPSLRRRSGGATADGARAPARRPDRDRSRRTVGAKEKPHPPRHGRPGGRRAARVRSGGRGDPGKCRSQGPGKAQAFLVSQKIRSISAMSSSAFSPVFGSLEPLAALSALRVSLTSWCSSGYFSKCGGLK